MIRTDVPGSDILRRQALEITDPLRHRIAGLLRISADSGREQTDAGSIVTLTCKLDSIWSADIEFNDLSTLDQIHDAIQCAVEFDDDHLYEFFIARTPRSRATRRYECDDDLPFNTRIRDVFPLPPKQNLYYLFDYGDSWIFRLSRSRKNPQPPVAGTNYPRVVNESGKKPVQYDDLDSDEW